MSAIELTILLVFGGPIAVLSILFIYLACGMQSDYRKEAK